MTIMAESQARPTVRAVGFARGVSGRYVAQREVIASAVAERGWSAGVTVRQCGPGLAAWGAVVRLVRRGVGDVVVVHSLDALADTDPGVAAVLRLLARSGVRLLAVLEGIDTGDPIGRDLAGSLLGGAV